MTSGRTKISQEFQDALKRFVKRGTTASRKERHEVLRDLNKLWADEATGISEGPLQTILQNVGFCLPRYLGDGTSCRELLAFVRQVLDKSDPDRYMYFFDLLSSFSSTLATGEASPYSRKLATMVLRIAAFLHSKIPKESAEWRNLTDILSKLLYVTLSTSRRSQEYIVGRIMKPVLDKEFSSEKLDSLICHITKEESPVYSIGYLKCVLIHAHQSKPPIEISDNSKASIISYVGRITFTSKIPPSAQFLTMLPSVLLLVDIQSFKDDLLPMLLKAFLRNPEQVLPSIVAMLKGLKIDMSSVCIEIGKQLGTQLHSKVPTSRKLSVEACRYLAERCADPLAIELLLKHNFSVLGGSEGKIIVAAERMDVLAGLGNLSYQPSCDLKLINAAVALFITAISTEAHEGTSVYGVSMMCLWARKSAEIPSALITVFKSLSSQKSAAVRTAYLFAMNSIAKGESIFQLLELFPVLSKAFDAAAAKPTDITLAVEALPAASLLLLLYSTKADAQKQQFFLNTLMDSNKQIFASDKFLQAANEDVMQQISIFIERLLTLHANCFKPESLQMYLKAFSVVLLRSPHPLFKEAVGSWKNIISQNRCGSLSEELLIALRTTFVKMKSTSLETSDASSVEEPNHAKRIVVILKKLVEFYVELGFSAAEKSQLIVESLFLCHDTSVVLVTPNLWITLLQRFQHDCIFPDKLIVDYTGRIWDRLISERCLSDDSLKAAIRTFMGFPASETVTKLFTLLKTELQKSEFSEVTLTDYMIFRTPSGVLHDKSVLEIADKKNDETNVKRESKAYSYKEQLAEIELRKELQAKRLAKFDGKELQLNPKQKEAMHKQLEKEKIIRQNVQQFFEKVQRLFLILDSMISGNPVCLRIYLSDLINIIQPLLHASLTASFACTSWALMSQCLEEALQKNGLALTLAMATLRVLEPSCPLPVEWTHENLSDMIRRVISALHRLCKESGDTANNGNEARSTITVPDLCFALPLITAVVSEQYSKNLNLKEEVAVQALDVLCRVLEICAGESAPTSYTMNGNFDDDDSVVAEMDENNPSFLPLSDILHTLILLAESGRQHFEQEAYVAIGHLIKAAAKVVQYGGQLDQKIISQMLNLLLSPRCSSRISAIQALIVLTDLLDPFLVDPSNRSFFEKRLFVAAHDVQDPKVAEFSKELFQELSIKPTRELLFAVLEDVSSSTEVIRNSAAVALGIALPYFIGETGKILEILMNQYSRNLEECKPKLDKYGRPMSELQADSWLARRGVAAALIQISACLNSDEVLLTLMEFLLQKPCALKDEKIVVRNDMLQVGITIVNDHGRNHVGALLTKLEEFFSTAPKTADYDGVRQSTIVIMGTLAKHLDSKHPKIRPIVHQLLAALATPSEEVQKAVGSCIAPLVVTIDNDIRSVVPNLLHVLYESDSYAHRRGAAYGLSGVFQGLGIMALKDYDIMPTIMEGLQDKKNAQKRESSLLAISMLSVGLGRVFEPFVMKSIPFVLQSIGDGNIHVRQAAEEASKAAMSQLSGPGVKLVLPALLRGLEEDAWRSKAASIEMLGDMAFCAPKQLSSGLPTVVPKLIETLGDSHTKVQESGVSALKKIASVIKNPEVLGLVPTVLSALQDPAKKTSSCLKQILQTQFIHVIDAASLALLMPVIHRAIYDRGTENRKLSAQIMASLYSLADQKDLYPYLEGVLPGLKNCLLDPAPEVRLSAAKAVAALVNGTGEAGFDQLKNWLFAKLVSENNSVDRSGAAQGLAESMGVLGVSKLREMMPLLLSTILNEKTPSHVRDGNLLIFVYLPVVYGQQFSPFISDVIPAILLGLADDTEYVRETALLCGQRIVTYFADSAIELLLPKLEEGMFDDNWRIRYASVQLLGDLLYKISGASGKHTTAGLEEDENFGTEQSHTAILERLGETHRNRVLAGLYISRSDNALMVRQAALHVWKVIVTNTPKTLREILSELFEILLDALASENEERRQVAAKTLGELVRKLGERILPEVIPILQDGLNSEADEHREGVCVGLMEIISSSNKEIVVMYCDILEPTLTKALLDHHSGVRRAAADAFCMLDNVVGHKVMDDILPVLFDKVIDPIEGDNALDGLQQIMARRSRVVLPYLIPRLIAPPVNTKTLALLTAVAGEALSKHLNKILPALLGSLQVKIGTPEEELELSYCKSVIMSVDDEVGVQTLVDSLMIGTQNEKTRLSSVTLLDLFFANTKTDIRAFFVNIIRPLMRLYIYDDPVLIKKISSILNSLIKRTPTDVVYDNVTALRTAIRSVHMELRGPSIPGLCIPDGAAVFIPMLRDALLSVSADEKELVGQTIADLVRLSSQAGLKTSVVTITGPIIRILGDRYSAGIRTVMFEALNALIEKCDTLLKPFVPQIQTTVSRAFSDPVRGVRVKAGTVAANIGPMHPRLEPLANDLMEVAKNNADLGSKETAFRSIRQLLATAGQKLSQQFRLDLVMIASRYLNSEENDLKNAAAGCLGAVCRLAVDDELTNLLKNTVFDAFSSEWTLQHGHCLALAAALREAGDKLTSEKFADSTMEVILRHHTSDRVQIVCSAIRCIGLFLIQQRKTEQALNKKLLIVLAKSLNHSATEVKQLVAQVCSHLALSGQNPLDISEMKLLVPQLVNGTKEKNTAVRYDSEMALVDVLAIRKDDAVFESYKVAVDIGARESLQNARKTLGKSVLQSVTKLEELDETL